jgi:uncharacterized membrane protein
VAVAALAAPALRAHAKEGGQRSIVYATYDDEQGARKAFDLLRKAEKEKLIGIESYAIISKDERGKVHVRDQRKKTAGTGAIVGAVVGVVGGPVGVVLGAGAGGAVGYLTGDAVGMPKEAVEQIKTSLEPGQSAVIAIVEERSVEDVTEDLQRGQARQMLRHPIKPAPGPQQNPQQPPSPQAPSQPSPPSPSR